MNNSDPLIAHLETPSVDHDRAYVRRLVQQPLRKLLGDHDRRQVRVGDPELDGAKAAHVWRVQPEVVLHQEGPGARISNRDDAPNYEPSATRRLTSVALETVTAISSSRAQAQQKFFKAALPT